MKADIHPNYHMIKVVMTNGTSSSPARPMARRARRSTSTSIRTPIRPGPAARSSCSTAAAVCRASTPASPARRRRQEVDRERAPRQRDNRPKLVTSPPPPCRPAMSRLAPRASGSLTAFMCQPLACSSVASRMTPTWPFQNTRSPRASGALGRRWRRARPAPSMHVAVARRLRSRPPSARSGRAPNSRSPPTSARPRDRAFPESARRRRRNPARARRPPSGATR